MLKARITITLTKQASDSIKNVRNCSAYISGLIERRDREWRHALSLLQKKGYSNETIFNYISNLDSITELSQKHTDHECIIALRTLMVERISHNDAVLKELDI